MENELENMGRHLDRLFAVDNRLYIICHLAIINHSYHMPSVSSSYNLEKV